MQELDVILKRISELEKELAQLRKLERVIREDKYIRVREWIFTKPEIIGRTVADVYFEYYNWCSKNSYDAVNKIAFSKILVSTINVISIIKTIDGKSTRVYQLNI